MAFRPAVLLRTRWPTCTRQLTSKRDSGHAFEVATERLIQLRVKEIKAAVDGDAPNKPSSLWPDGLLGGNPEDGPVVLHPILVSELLYDVGWHARHQFIDVRTPEAFASGRVMGARNVTWEHDDASFVERVEVSLASSRRAGEDPLERDVRLVVGGAGGVDAAEVQAAGVALLRAGFVNAVTLDGGFARWQAENLSEDRPDDEELPDSTF